MKELTSEEIKEVSLDILKYIDCLCRNNNIMYYIAYGTLLGAIRHKGFIPWDDDIDIVMFRKEYNKLLQCFMNNTSEDKYQLICYELDKDYYQLTAKVYDKRTLYIEDVLDSKEIGVHVDIFVIDYLSDNYKNAKRIIKKISLRYLLLLGKMISEREGRSKLKTIVFHVLKKISSIINKNAVFGSIQKIATTYKDETKYCGAAMSCVYREKEIMESKWFSNSIELEFEKNTFHAPIGYHEILTHLYGNYMILPPVEKRKTHHSYSVYWRE